MASFAKYPVMIRKKCAAVKVIPYGKNDFSSKIHKSVNGEFSVFLEQDGSVGLCQGRPGYSWNYNLIQGGVVNNKWQHIALTRNITTREVKGYLDGEFKYAATYPNDSNYYPPAATGAVTIGSGYFSDYNGGIDKVRLYSRVLDQEEIQAMNLLSAYPDKNYYTTENPVAVCRLNVSSAGDLNYYARMVAKDAQGNSLGTNTSPGINTDVTYDASSLSKR